MAFENLIARLNQLVPGNFGITAADVGSVDKAALMIRTRNADPLFISVKKALEEQLDTEEDDFNELLSRGADDVSECTLRFHPRMNADLEDLSDNNAALRNVETAVQRHFGREFLTYVRVEVVRLGSTMEFSDGVDHYRDRIEDFISNSRQALANVRTVGEFRDTYASLTARCSSLIDDIKIYEEPAPVDDPVERAARGLH